MRGACTRVSRTTEASMMAPWNMIPLRCAIGTAALAAADVARASSER